MAEPSELPLAVRLFLKAYPWRRISPVPWTPLRKPLAQCRVALASSGGFHLPEQEPFDSTYRGGDPSFRLIPGETEAGILRENHRSESFDHSGLQSDPNLGLPMDRLRELQAGGRIGSVAPRHVSFMGSITAPGRLIQQTAPAAAQALADDGVEVALFVPV